MILQLFVRLEISLPLIIQLGSAVRDLPFPLVGENEKNNEVCGEDGVLVWWTGVDPNTEDKIVVTGLCLNISDYM